MRTPQSLGLTLLSHGERAACPTCFMDGLESGFFLTKPLRRKEELQELRNPTL